MTSEVKTGNIVVTLLLALAVVVGVSTLLKSGKCDPSNVCLTLTVAFDPPNRNEKVNIWVDINGVRLISASTRNSPWKTYTEIAPGTQLMLIAEQIELKQPGVLDCKIDDLKSPPKYNYRTGNGQVSCLYIS